MVRQNFGAGNGTWNRGGSTGRGRRGSTGRGGRGELRGARLGVLAALALVFPIALAAPAAGHTALGQDESVAVQTPLSVDGQPRQTQKAESAGFSNRHYYSTSRDARTYRTPESRHPTGGWLRNGRHAFFCQVEGEPHTYGEDGYSTWWALIDDDADDQDVFVSATAFQVSEPWQPIEGLPRC